MQDKTEDFISSVLKAHSPVSQRSFRVKEWSELIFKA